MKDGGKGKQGKMEQERKQKLRNSSEGLSQLVAQPLVRTVEHPKKPVSGV